jgi:parallel beta-helix repeat protein
MLNGSTVSGNTAQGDGGVYGYETNITLSDGTIEGNTAHGHGGGIYAYGYARPTLLRTTRPMTSTITGTVTRSSAHNYEYGASHRTIGQRSTYRP